MRFNTIGVNYDSLEQLKAEEERITENYGLTLFDELIEEYDEVYYAEYDISNCTGIELAEIFKDVR